MWVVSCDDRSDTSDCMINGCDGLAYVWDGEQWQEIGSIQGPPGNNVDYFYEDFTATEGQTEFDLSRSVQIEASFVTINGVVIAPIPDNYTLELEKLTLTSDVAVKAGDVVGIFSFIGAVNAIVAGLTTADIGTVGTRPNEVKKILRQDIKNQQEANWYLLDAIDNIEIPEDQDLSTYATIDAMQAGDADTLAAANTFTTDAIAAIPPVDLSDYATKKESTDGDAKSLSDSKKYTDDKIAAIVFPPGTIVKDTEPQNVPNGTNWFDTVRLELFVRASDSWLPSSPLAARVSQGEIVQAQILDRIDGLTTTEYVDGADQAVQRFATTADEAVLNAAKKYTDDTLGTIPDVSSDVDKAYVDAQDATKIGNTGDEVLPTSRWKLRAPKVDDSGNYSYISIQDDTLKLYHVADPTADAHGMSRGFADARYQFPQRQIVFKCDQYVTCTTASSPPDGGFCGLNNSSVGSATSPNPYFGNWNAGMRVALNKLLNPEGNQFSDGERYTISGTVTVIDKAGKLYFKAAVSSVNRSNNNSYVNINFATRVPAFGTGAYNDSSDYVVIVEGLESVVPATSNIPEVVE